MNLSITHNPISIYSFTRPRISVTDYYINDIHERVLCEEEITHLLSSSSSSRASSGSNHGYVSLGQSSHVLM